MVWLLKYCKQEHLRSKIPQLWSAAAKAGQVSMLQILHDTHQPCRWDKCGIAACNSCQRHVLKWLRANEYPWTLECIRQAAANGDVRMLGWMRTQEHPWPWESSICTAAKQQPAALRWLLDQDPPCPWTAEEAADCPEALARLGDVGLMERLRLPAQKLPQLCVLAAREGQLPFLKWLQQQPSCQMTGEVCQAAMSRNDDKIVHYLVAELQPLVFPSTTPILFAGGAQACLLVLA